MALSDYTICELHLPDPQWAALVAEARAEGYSFMDRMDEQWRNGSNRFASQGEQLLAAYHGLDLVAVAGLNIDPYAHDDSVARLRHVYVRKDHRHQGLARALVWRLMIRASDAGFATLRLRAASENAARLYLAMGFRPCYEPRASHVLRLHN